MRNRIDGISEKMRVVTGRPFKFLIVEDHCSGWRMHVVAGDAEGRRGWGRDGTFFPDSKNERRSADDGGGMNGSDNLAIEAQIMI